MRLPRVWFDAYVYGSDSAYQTTVGQNLEAYATNTLGSFQRKLGNYKIDNKLSNPCSVESAVVGFWKKHNDGYFVNQTSKIINCNVSSAFCEEHWDFSSHDIICPNLSNHYELITCDCGGDGRVTCFSCEGQGEKECTASHNISISYHCSSCDMTVESTHKKFNPTHSVRTTEIIICPNNCRDGKFECSKCDGNKFVLCPGPCTMPAPSGYDQVPGHWYRVEPCDTCSFPNGNGKIECPIYAADEERYNSECLEYQNTYRNGTTHKDNRVGSDIYYRVEEYNNSNHSFKAVYYTPKSNLLSDFIKFIKMYYANKVSVCNCRTVGNGWVEFYNPNGTTFYANTSELPVNSSYRGVYLPNGRNMDGGYGNDSDKGLRLNDIDFKSRYFVIEKDGDQFKINGDTSKNGSNIHLADEPREGYSGGLNHGQIPSGLSTFDISNQGIEYGVRNNTGEDISVTVWGAKKNGLTNYGFGMDSGMVNGKINSTAIMDRPNASVINKTKLDSTSSNTIVYYSIHPFGEL